MKIITKRGIWLTRHYAAADYLFKVKNLGWLHSTPIWDNLLNKYEKLFRIAEDSIGQPR